MSDFVHLHVHSHYSLLDGAIKIDKLVQRAVEFEMPAISLTDHGNMFGAVEFYLACQAQGIKPLIGMESYMAPGGRRDKTAKGIKNAARHLTLIAMNNTGYHNLAKLSSSGYIDGFYYRPRIDKEIFSQLHQGIIAMSGCLSGEIPSLLLADRRDEALAAANFYSELLGDRFYLEIQKNGIPEQDQANGMLAELSRETGIPLVASSDMHYLYREDAEVHDALLCIQTGKKVSDTVRMRFPTDQFYFKSPDEMKADFVDYPDAVERTLEIAGRCDVTLDFDTQHMPVFTPDSGEDPSKYLRRISWEGVLQRYGSSPSDQVKERFEFELDMLIRLGYASYYLIVWDFIKHARSIGIPVGPGRGSGAGSLVAYSLRITDLDPLKYGLLFERFLNPDRVSPPDFDIDICQERRGEVIEYVRNKYGRDSVAQIITFGTMGARAAIRDSGRVLEVPLPETDKIAKLIPETVGITIEEALQQEKELRDLNKNDPIIARLLTIARGLEGLARHCGTHAAGVIIGDQPLGEMIPLFVPSGEDLVSTQYDMKMSEKLGLLKMDFLGLQTLTVIDKACKLIKETTGQSVDISSIPLDEQKAYQLLWRGETKGVFQMESSGMTELVMRLKPDCFEDMIALVALYRPGPLGSGMVETYVQCKHGNSDPGYRHPTMKPILKETHGVILYQEQVQSLAREMAGYSLGEGDILRRAMGKKITEVMAEQRGKFVDGCVANKISSNIAEQVFQDIEYFAGYGFNKSHSACYGLLAYQTAYLKALYPVEFMSAVLTLDSGNTDKVVDYINDCSRMNLEVLPPDINISCSHFTPSEGRIRFGLSALKGVGSKAVEAIVAARQSHGAFRDIFELCEHVDTRACNRSVLEAMIKAGAFDSTGHKRSQNSAVLEAALSSGSRLARDRAQGQMTLLDTGNFVDQEKGPSMPAIPEWPEKTLLEFEKSVMGFYLSGHPLSRHKRMISRYSSFSTKTISSARDGAEVLVGGLIAAIKTTVTKKQGKRMARLTLEDLYGTVEVVVFPRTYEKFIQLIIPDSIVFIKGKADAKSERVAILVDEIIPLDEARATLTGSVVMRFDNDELNEGRLDELEGLLKRHRGSCLVYFQVNTAEGKVVTVQSGSGGVKPSTELYDGICKLVGEKNMDFLPAN